MSFTHRCHARAAFHARRVGLASIALRLVISPDEVLPVDGPDDGDLARALGIDGRYSRTLALESFIEVELQKAHYWTGMAEEQELLSGTVFPGGA